MELRILIRTISPLLLATALTACEKEITVDLPRTEPRVVVEASIETGKPPFVMLSRTQNFFDPTSLASIAGSFIQDADVYVDDGFNVVQLDKICSSTIPEDMLEDVALAIGFDPALLANANICVWTLLNGTLLGENGRSYRLEVHVEGRTITGLTHIPHPVPLDSIWFQLALQQPNDDSTGYIWARLSDPDTLGNHYRWFAQRLNKRADGRMKDGTYIAPLFSVFEDRYVNGLSFDFNIGRGRAPYTEAEDEPDEVAGFFKRNDTVAVKFASIDRNGYRFFDSYANNVVTNGDVFSTPANISSNIEGGLGVWIGYGTFLDTVICIP